MFCDPANSTKLSGQLDPEDLRDVIRAYQSTRAEVIERYDGYIAQHLGGGLMVYFGWPQTHEALAIIEQTEKRIWEAELYRLKGGLLSKAAWTPEACFQRALEVARRQQAKAWELRAAASLARLWQSQGKRLGAYDLLSPVYEWFMQGFDTLDLQDAKTLLDELEGS
jgi:class 3 adenylate cyclase